MDEHPIDRARYGTLLAAAQPGVIETPEEHERLLGIAEDLMERAQGVSPEEEKLLALLVLLIEAYEASVEATEDDDDDDSPSVSHRPPLPHETLGRLMKARGLDINDVASLFGNPHLAREVLEGKRTISRGEAKELGRFFQVPPKLFHL